VNDVDKLFLDEVHDGHDDRPFRIGSG
jgi:hypothetical protein